MHHPLAAPDWETLRGDFPILDQRVGEHRLIYFDNAASTQKPLQVIDQLRHYYERDNANVHRGLHELSSRATEAYENARAKVAGYLRAASTQEIIFTRGTTEAINLVAQSWGRANLKKGEGILLTELEHHSNLVPWQMLAEQTGACLRFVPVDGNGELDLANLESLLAQSRIFSFTHCSNSLGTINPCREMCARASRQGVVTLVDGAQSAGHMPVNLQEMGCDFYAFSGHKMCGPTGVGALYGRRELLEAMPPWQGGGEMIVKVEWERSTFRQPPARFEAGTPHIAGAVGLGAAVDYLATISLANIQAHDRALTQYAMEVLRDVPGLRLFGPEAGKDRGALVSFVMESAHPHDLVTYANEYGLALRGGHHCTQPLMKKLGVTGTARASFYFYNTMEEIDQMVKILRAAAQFFG